MQYMSFEKRQRKSAAALLAAGMLLFNTAIALAAPVELSLEDSITAALSTSSTIKMADADKEKAAWGIKEAETGKMPSVSLGSSYNLNQSSSSQPGDDDFSNSLRVNWQLYTGGRIAGQINQAEQNAKSADVGVAKAKQQVKFDTATGYFNVLQAQSMVAVQEETVKSLQEHLRIVQAKYGAGMVAKSDVLRSEVELANAEQNLMKNQNNYNVALASLKNAISAAPDAELILKDELKYEKYETSLAESIEFAKLHRPDIIQADISVKSAEVGVKVAESGKRPSVSLGGSTGWGDSLLPSDNDWSWSVSANWNVFDAGAVKSKIKQADLSVEKAKEQAKQTSNNVELEVRQVYLSMQEAEKRLDTTQKAIAKAEEDLYIAQEKYNAGVGTSLDVIDARLSFTQAKTNYVQALYDYNTNKVKLNKAVGAEVK
jgi:outer membrane protein